MKSDHEIYELFKVVPEMVYEFMGEEKPDCAVKMESVTMKQVEKRIDSVFFPVSQEYPVILFEFQMDKKDDIYHRFAIEAGVFSLQNKSREVIGRIIFRDKSVDPDTEPYNLLFKTENRFFKVYYLDELLEQFETKNPEHPLLMVFKPFLVTDETIIKTSAKKWYDTIEKSDLDNSVKEKFLEILEIWLMARFQNMTYQEIYNMIKPLTPLKETRAYQDIRQEVVENEKDKWISETFIETAQKMLAENADEGFISRVTGLSIEQIHELKAGLK